MPWFAWIAIAGIIMFALITIVGTISGRELPWNSGDDKELEDLRRRVQALERGETGQLEGPRIPTKAEENLAAEDRWRLDSLEARLESLEKKQKGDGEAR